MGVIGVITGFAAEAAIARHDPSAAVSCSGGVPFRAMGLAEGMIAAGVRGVVSFGIAGGVAPGLVPGTLILATIVLADGEEFPVHGPWRDRLAGRLPSALAGSMVGGMDIVATPEAKADLHRSTGALAVDMESAMVALACRHARVPFVVVRAVADGAGRALPPAACLDLGRDGHPRGGAIAQSIFRDPSQIPALVAVALDVRAALRSLGRVARNGFGEP